MVDVANCLLCKAAQTRAKLVSIIRNSGCLLLRGFECIEVYRDIVQIPVILSQTSTIEGFPLSRVSLMCTIVITDVIIEIDGMIVLATQT